MIQNMIGPGPKNYFCYFIFIPIVILIENIDLNLNYSTSINIKF